MAIYSEINNQSVLEYPCQGLFLLSTFYIPREIWKNKPLTYTAYFTSALIDEPPEFQHFGMTTGIFGECISNFGIVIGILLSIFIVLQVTLCAIRFEDQIFKLISLLWSSLLLTNDINSFKVIGVVWCLYYFSIKKYNRI